MRTLLASTALLALVVSPAWADALSVTATEDGTNVGTESSADGTLNIVNQAFGTFNLNTLTINDENFLAKPGILNTNTLDVQQNSSSTAHTFVLDITATGLTSPTGLTQLLNEFSVTGLTSGWTVQEATFINGALQAMTPVVSANSASADVTTTANLTSPFSAEVRYTIVTAANTAGQFNGGIDISAVPAPILGAGLPGMLAGVMALLGFARRRRNKLS